MSCNDVVELDIDNRDDRDDELNSLWARVDALEELVNFLYDRFDVVYVAEEE